MPGDYLAIMATKDQRVLVQQGAEAKLYQSSFYGKPCIIKERFSKSYRNPALDRSLTQQRLKSEARAALRCRMNGIRVPTIYFIDLETNSIYMEEVENAVTVRNYINNVQQDNLEGSSSKLKWVAKKIGQLIGKMHRNNIIHGDLTTSNMLLQGSPEDPQIIVIDFGLSHFDSLAEDKGVDLYVLERAFLSTHPNTEELFELILSAYKEENGAGADDVIAKLEEVRMRGRKRTMVG